MPTLPNLPSTEKDTFKIVSVVKQLLENTNIIFTSDNSWTGHQTWSMTNPTITFNYQAFDSGNFTKTLGSMEATWDSGAGAIKGSTLIVQSIAEASAPAAGAAGALATGLVNKSEGNDGFGLLSCIANTSVITTPTGTAMWGIARQYADAGTVDAVRGTSETFSNEHPRCGLFVSNSAADNAFENGIWVTGGVNYGVRVGVPNTNPENIRPTYPFAFETSTGDGRPFYIDTNGAGLFTKADGYGVTVRSEASNKFAAIGIGRTAVEGAILLSAGANTLFTGTAAGDLVISGLGAAAEIWLGNFTNNKPSLHSKSDGTLQFSQYGTGILQSDSTGNVSSKGVLSRTAPVTETSTTHTIATTTSHLICNNAAAVTVTFPSAASFPGRELYIKTITTGTVVSASSNVVPSTSPTAGTAVLPATDGAWAFLVSDGSNWVIMAANPLV